MDIRVLGPVELWSAGSMVPLGPARQRSLLAVLAADAGRLVTLDTVIDRIWGAQPPERARDTLYVHIARLRRVLANAGADRSGVLVHRAGGYVLDVDPDEVDLHRFENLVTRARADPDDAGRARRLREALGLWRGVALADLSGGWVERVRGVWGRRRLDAALAWAQAELRAGDPGRLVGPLTELLDENPLAENLATMLMRALHATGRRAEALDCYAGIRQRLVDELGIDPGAELQEVHRQILTSDEPGPTGPDRADPPPAHVPHQLPLPVAGFTGRQLEIFETDNALGRAAETATAPVILAITGTAGVGKTALAVHWAHRVTGSFPDGQLYLDLHGYHPVRPVEPDAALAAFLRALGVAPANLPDDLDERAALYRSLLARRRMLIVLDNASSADQVRPLLPGSRTCFVVVTSRDTLAGLVARDGAHRVRLDALPMDDALALLHATVGETVLAAPETAATLADLCARLPLALRVAAELAAARPELGLADLVAGLTDERRRLDLLDTGDRYSAVRAVFSWSYRRLDPATRDAFRRIALHPGTEVDRYAVAALLPADLAEAGRALDTLAGAHLVTRLAPDRYTMHDLLRVYAREVALAEDGEEDRRAAVTRLLDHYRYTAAVAMDRVAPAESVRRPRVDPPDGPTPDLPDQPTATAWLETERRSLVAVTTHAAEHGWPRHAIHLAVIIWRLLYLGGHDAETLAMNTRALELARETGEHAFEAQLLNQIGAVWLRRGDPGRAIRSLTEALELVRRVGDRTNELRILGNLGIYHARAGQYDLAVDVLTRLAATHAERGDRAFEGQSVANLAEVHRLQGRPEKAIEVGDRAVALYRESDQRVGLGMVLNNLGLARLELGHLDAAAADLREALRIHREFGNRDSEGAALNGLALVHSRRDDHAEAVLHHELALAIYRRTGNHAREADALICLGDTLRRSGAAARAETCYRSALELSRTGGDRRDQARALAGLAEVSVATGRGERADAYWREALDLYTALGVPEAGRIRQQLRG
jgi:DNA-binding SARP family transcriptional activator/Tfp pilus assembly protein PilF